MEKANSTLNKSLKLLIKTSFIVFIGLVFSKLLSYGYRIIIARYFGPEIYGVFSLALMISGWFISISALGMSEGLLRYIPLYRGKKEFNKIRYIFKFANYLLLFSSIISGILLFALSSFISINLLHNSELTIFLKIFSILVPVSVIGYPYITSLRAFERINLYSQIYNIWQNVIKLAALILFVYIGMKSNAIAFSYLCGLAGMLVISYFVCKYKLPELFGKIRIDQNTKKKIKSDLLRYSIPLLLFGIISTIFYWVDSFAIGYFKTATEVGYYNAAMPIALLLTFVPELFMQLFFPLINREYSRKNSELIKEISKQIGKWIFIVNLPIFILIMLFPGAVINILFGSSYLAAENALRFLIFGSLFYSMFIISNNLISMTGRSKVILADIVIVTIINIILNIILIPMPHIFALDNASGINGASIATSLSFIILNLMFMVQAKKYTGIIPLRRKMLNILLISIIPTIVLIYLKGIMTINLISIILLTILFFAIYLVLIFATKSFDRNDILIIRQSIDKAIQLKKRMI